MVMRKENGEYPLNAKVVLTTGRKGAVVNLELAVVAGSAFQGPVPTANVDAQRVGEVVVAEYHIDDFGKAYKRVVSQVAYKGRGRLLSSEELGLPKEAEYPRLKINKLLKGED
jgi:hypothetical protein